MIKFLNIMGNVAETLIDYGVIWIADIICIAVFVRGGAAWKSYAILAAASAIGCVIWHFILKLTERRAERAVNRLCNKIFHNEEK